MSMDEIIEIFADALGSFLLTSIRLQEQNAPPSGDLAKNADAVVSTAKVMNQVAREMADTEFRDYQELARKALVASSGLMAHLQMLITFFFLPRLKNWPLSSSQSSSLSSQSMSRQLD